MVRSSQSFGRIVSSFIAVGVSNARIHIGEFADSPQVFTSVVFAFFRSHSQGDSLRVKTELLSDTFDCVRPASRSNLGLCK
jgi:hypothetical protein